MLAALAALARSAALAALLIAAAAWFLACDENDDYMDCVVRCEEQYEECLDAPDDPKSNCEAERTDCLLGCEQAYPEPSP